MTTKRKSTSSAPTTTTTGAASASSKRVKTSSTSTSYNEEGGERVLTEKEKRKAARMVRNRLSAQNSRDKKRHHLESLESTIHHLQAENKDLMQRLIRATGDSTLGNGNGNGNGGGAGMGMGMGRLPLSPGPSSLKEREEEGSEGDSDDEEEEEEESYTPLPSSQNESRRSSTQTTIQPHPSSSQAQSQPQNQPQQSTDPTPQSNLFNQSLVTLTTENLALKDRIKKLENVIQVLVAGTAIGSGGFGLNVVPSAVNYNSSAASVSVPPQAVMKVEDVQTQYPLTAINPMSLVSPPFHAQQSSHYQPQASTSTSNSAFLPTPTFTPNNQDRACQPAALAIASPSLVEEESTLQRARFFPSHFHKKGRVNKDKDKDKEEREQRWKMEVGLKRVLRWRRGVEVEVGAGA